MPQILHSRVLQQADLGVWEISEELKELEALSRSLGLGAVIEELCRDVSNVRRKKELIATRLLLHGLANGKTILVEYDMWGKPMLKNSNQKISISHCRSHAALLIHNELESGIDIEIKSERILSIAERFMSKTEWSYMPNETDLDYLHLIWAAKECIYKIHGRHGVIFRNDISVNEFDIDREGRLEVTLKKNNVICEYHLHYQSDDEKVMVYGWQEKNACRSL